MEPVRDGLTKQQRYNRTLKGKAAKWRYQHDKPRRGKTPGMSAEAQRERRSRPEYRLAKHLGISVSVARDMLAWRP